MATKKRLTKLRRNFLRHTMRKRHLKACLLVIKQREQYTPQFSVIRTVWIIQRICSETLIFAKENFMSMLIKATFGTSLQARDSRSTAKRLLLATLLMLVTSMLPLKKGKKTNTRCLILSSHYHQMETLMKKLFLFLEPTVSSLRCSLLRKS